MPFIKGYIDKIYKYAYRDKVTHEEYNNGFNLLAAANNNNVEGIDEALTGLQSVQEALVDLSVGVMPDNSITSDKLAGSAVKSEHLEDSVYNKIASLKYAHMFNNNIAYTIFLGTGDVAPTAYKNVHINRAPALQPLSIKISPQTVEVQNFSMTANSSPSFDGTGASNFQGSAQLSTSGRLIGKSGYRPNIDDWNTLISTQYSQRFDLMYPFDANTQIKIIPESQESLFSLRKDMYTRGMKGAWNNLGLKNKITVKGVYNGGMETTVYEQEYTGSFPQEIVLNSTAWTYTAYKVYYSLNILFKEYGTDNDEDYNYYYTMYDKGTRYIVGWKPLRFPNSTGLDFDSLETYLFKATLYTATTIVFDTLSTGPITLDEATRYITVGYKATEPLTIDVYTDDAPEAVSNGTAELIQAAPTGSGVNVYRHHMELNSVTKNLLVIFKTNTEESSITNVLKEYYIVG